MTPYSFLPPAAKAVVVAGLIALHAAQASAQSYAPLPHERLPAAYANEAPAPPSVPAETAASAEAGGEAPAADVNAADVDKLLDLAEKDVKQLSTVRVAAPSLNAEVTTVSRQKTTVGRSPAAVFVITNEMIRRSGATSVPEALRMAPGVNVSRIDASKWAISIRGFNGRFANKLLVQIDGRSVYTPLFGGVFWDVQDVLLEDVERIEIIRGPGATIWGANAVNGIINVITKKAADTQGTYAQAGAGTEERGFVNARQGGEFGETGNYRVYGKWFERDTGYAPPDNAHDDWRQGRTGFRADWTSAQGDACTVQGDVYKGVAGERSVHPSLAPPFFTVGDEDVLVGGGNLLYRLTRTLDDDTEWSVQTYYDRTERRYEQIGFREFRDTVDVDFQYRFRPWDCHSVIWGASYRNTRDTILNSPDVIEFLPPQRADDLFSYFIQDEVTLRDDFLFLTLGAKFQHNDYTGFELQPTVRLLCTPDERHSLWASVSRAVRTPTRANDSVILTSPPQPTLPGVLPQLLGNPDGISEELIAYEVGMRAQPTERFSWDAAAFFHQYNELSSQIPQAPIPGVPTILPFLLANGVAGQSYGFELAANYEASECWRLTGSYSNVMHFPAGDPVTSGEWHPRNQIYLQSSWDVACDWEFDLAWRFVDTTGAVDSYNVFDARLAWFPNCNTEVALVARNLGDNAHSESLSDPYVGTLATEVQHEVYGSMTVRY